MEKYRHKSILVIGLGVSGSAAAELLAEKGFHVRVTDNSASAQISRCAEFLRDKHSIAIEIGGHTKEFCSVADLVIASPGVDLNYFYDNRLLSRTVPVIGELELGYKFCSAPIVAVTGTNGKTTTTELMGKILQKSGIHTVVCGNIGNPLCGEIAGIKEDSIVVLEVSSYQLENIEDFCPLIGILLNVSEDHLDRHGGYSQYKKTKFNLFENQTENCWALIYSGLKGDVLTSTVNSNIVYFGDGDAAARVDQGQISITADDGKDLFIGRENMLLEGKHNLYNVAACALAAKILGVPGSVIKDVISKFSPLSHRVQKLGIFNGIEYIDDSKATNIDATRAALESLNKDVILIAGGVDKGGDYSSLSGLIRDKVKTMILIGEAAEKIRCFYAATTRVIKAHTLEQAVSIAARLGEPGDVVILSPMCSSFDMFSNYKHRGEVYQQAVKKISARRVKT